MRSVTHYDLGNELFAAGRPDASIAQFREAIRLRADNARAVHDLGAVLAGRGDLAAAREHYERALRLDPSFRHVRARLRHAQARRPAPGTASASRVSAACSSSS